jgi:hypothetical protein
MINEDMTRLKTCWLSMWTNFVIFERRRDVLLSDQYVVCYGNEIVRRVDSVKYLGLHLDSKISFSVQICHIWKKILPIMLALRGYRDDLITPGTAMSINYAYSLINILAALQNRILKIIKCKLLYDVD